MNTLVLAAALLFLIVAWICAFLAMRYFRKAMWWKITGQKWEDPKEEWGDPWIYQDGILTILAKADERDRFEEARRLASKLEHGHPWTSRAREIPQFGVYASR